MHVALVSNYYPDRRQLAEYGLHLAEGLRQARPEARVTVLAGTPGPPGVARVWRYGSLWIAHDVPRAVAALQPDAVIVNHSFSSWGDRHVANFAGFLAIARLARRWPTVALIHHLPQTMQLEHTGYRISPVIRLGIDVACRLMARATRVVSLLEENQRYFADHFKPRGTLFLEHGLPGRAEPQPWQSGTPCVLAFGVWGPSKDLEPLLRVAQDDLRLVIGGRTHWRFPDYLPSLERRYPQCTFTGYVPEEDLAALFGSSWLVVLPYHENTGASGVLRLVCKFGRTALVRDLPVFRAEGARLGLRLHYYRDDAELGSQLRGLLAQPDRLREEGLHNSRMMAPVEMDRIGERYWQLLESL